MKKFHKISILVIFCFTLILFISSISHSESGYSQLPFFQKVVPTAYSNIPGTSSFTGPLTISQRTYQLLINESQLIGMQVSVFHSITFRLPVAASANWPASDVTYANYDVYLSNSVDPANRSFTFSDNVIGVQKKVRSGSLTIPANSFTTGNTPNEFGMEITFDSSWFYIGGNLLIEIRHDGTTGTSRSVDAIGTAISGYGTDFSALWQSSYTAVTGIQGNFSVAKINFDYVQGISNNEIPDKFEMKQNYPNPFNPKTIINYNLTKTDNVSLKVYDALGREVADLVNQNQRAGNYDVEFDGSNLSSGIYIARLITAEFSKEIKMILSK
ncbi:MAG: T9SS type A sorting domain-containing protein [Ignavibacteria bacterium]